MSDEFTVCLLDERATNLRIHEDESALDAGRTLCGRRTPLLQTNPPDAPLFSGDGKINPLKRFTFGAWTIGHWFSHYRLYGEQPMYVLCDHCATAVSRAFANPRSLASTADT